MFQGKRPRHPGWCRPLVELGRERRWPTGEGRQAAPRQARPRLLVVLNSGENLGTPVWGCLLGPECQAEGTGGLCPCSRGPARWSSEGSQFPAWDMFSTAKAWQDLHVH